MNKEFRIVRGPEYGRVRYFAEVRWFFGLFWKNLWYGSEFGGRISYASEEEAEKAIVEYKTIKRVEASGRTVVREIETHDGYKLKEKLKERL
jgi:hypothetical protein